MDNVKYNIGVVEDDRMAGEFLVWQLEKNPSYQVKLFGSGEELLKSDYKADVLVLDYNLDSVDKHAMSGADVADKVGSTPIIMLTGQKDLNTAVGILRSGVCDYIVKDDNAPEKVEKSIADVIEYFRDNSEIDSLHRKNKREKTRVLWTLSLVALVILLSVVF